MYEVTVKFQLRLGKNTRIIPGLGTDEVRDAVKRALRDRGIDIVRPDIMTHLEIKEPCVTCNLLDPPSWD